MNRTMMRSKIHRIAVTQCDVTYEGSLTLDRDLKPLIANVAATLTDFEVHVDEQQRAAFDRAVIELGVDYPAGTAKLTGLRLGPQEKSIVGAAVLRPARDGATYKLSGRIDHADLAYVLKRAGLPLGTRDVSGSASADFDLRFSLGKIVSMEVHLAGNAGIEDPGTASVGNLVFLDENGNGTYEAGEGLVGEVYPVEGGGKQPVLVDDLAGERRLQPPAEDLVPQLSALATDLMRRLVGA